MQEAMDEKLAQAVHEVLQTGRLTPLIKEELRCTILARRHAEGKEEIEVEFKPPTPTELRPEEMEKKEDRKLRNRIAAQKFRRKRKDQEHLLVEECQRLQAHNRILQDEVDRLQQEKAAILIALGQTPCLVVHETPHLPPQLPPDSLATEG